MNINKNKLGFKSIISSENPRSSMNDICHPIDGNRRIMEIIIIVS